MFQYACGKSLACRKKTKLVLDHRFLETPEYPVTPRKYELSSFNIKTALFDEIDLSLLPEEVTLVKETRHLKYDPTIIEKINKHTYLFGYWQSWKYFCDIESIIRKRFCPVSQQVVAKEYLHLAGVLRQRQSVSIHVRRTDYTYPVYAFISALPLTYYLNAIKYILQNISNPVFYIFSDDPDWVEAHLKPSGETHIIRNNTIAGDLFLMSCCRHHIIANSTFSWWGAWLNDSPDKLVIAPKTWLIGKNWRTENLDIIPPGWITIEINGQ